MIYRNISLRRITNENINKSTLRRCRSALRISTLRRCSCSVLHINRYWGLDPLSDQITINDFSKVIYDNGSIFCYNLDRASLRNLSVFSNRHL
jgi:hypothetical protein